MGVDRLSGKQSDGEYEDGGIGCSELCHGTAGKALFIAIALQLTQQFSGINAVMFYSGGILEDVYPSSTTTANHWALGIQVMQVCITIIIAPFMDRAGRRFLLILSMTGMCCSTVLLAVFYLKNDPATNDASVASNHTLRCVAVVGLYAYVAFFSCGLGAIPWAMMGELFPIRVKGTASSIATLVNWLGSFVITKTLDNLTSAFGPSPDPHHKGRGWVFVLYGSICMLGLILTIAIVPETKGKSLELVQRELADPICRCRQADDDEEDVAA